VSNKYNQANYTLASPLPLFQPAGAKPRPLMYHMRVHVCVCACDTELSYKCSYGIRSKDVTLTLTLFDIVKQSPMFCPMFGVILYSLIV